MGGGGEGGAGDGGGGGGGGDGSGGSGEGGGFGGGEGDGGGGEASRASLTQLAWRLQSVWPIDMAQMSSYADCAACANVAAPA